MLSAFLASSAADATALVSMAGTPEAERFGVYVMAAIFGLLVSGLISLAKDIRADLLDRR